MTRKTQEEINYWFQENTIKSGMDLSLIEKILHINNLDTPNNIIIHKNGLMYDDFARWYCDEVKENTYPKTYKECWKVRFEVDGETTLEEFHNVSGYYSGPLGALQKLLCCRDAYWKIAGEEMGLDEPWKPDYNDLNVVMYGLYDELKYSIINPSQFVFPTEEMRDTFYENFKDLIEQCKELL